MNKVILMGRLTRDPEVRYGADDKAVARFTLAVDRRFRRNEDTQTADFINCVAFGKTAEFIEKYAHKGTKFLVEGRFKTGSFQRNDGTKVYTTEIVVESIEFAESKSKDAAAEPVADQGDGFMNIPDGIDEELPFN